MRWAGQVRYQLRSRGLGSPDEQGRVEEEVGGRERDQQEEENRDKDQEGGQPWGQDQAGGLDRTDSEQERVND